jgi:hypothetical protein
MTHGAKRANHSRTPNPPGPPQINRIRRFNLFRVFGYVGIVSVFGGLTLWNHFRPMWTPLALPGGAKAHWLQLAQCGVILLLAILWVIATHREFKLWTEVLENPAEKRQVYAAIIALSLGLGASLAFSFDIVWVSLTFTIYLLVNYWSQWLSNDYFARALIETRKKTKLLEPSRQAVIAAMERYWLKRAQLARITTLMFFSALAFALAFAGHFAKNLWQYRLQESASLVLILTIITGEMVIAMWRRKRDKLMRQTSAQVDALTVPRRKEKLASSVEEGDVKGFRIASYFGIFAVLLTVAAGLNDFRQSLLDIPADWNREGWLFVAAAIFFLELFALAILWIAATDSELTLWIDELQNPVGKTQIRLAMIGLSLVLGILLAYAYNIVFASGFATLYFLVNYWTQWLSNDHFTRALARTRATSPTATKMKVLAIMEEYWLARPQMARITTLMFFAAMAFSLALAGWMQEGAQRSRFYLAAYIVLMLDILVGEIVIFVWRQRRKCEIEAIQPAE